MSGLVVGWREEDGAGDLVVEGAGDLVLVEAVSGGSGGLSVPWEIPSVGPSSNVGLTLLTLLPTFPSTDIALATASASS